MSQLRSIVLFILSVQLAGCFGIAHVQVNVPPIEIAGTVSKISSRSSKDSITIVVPNIYGEDNAFVDLVGERLASSHNYNWKIIPINKDRHFITVFKEESRYIGFAPPFSPSEEEMESRLFFLWLDRSDIVYRVKLIGDRSVARKIDISAYRSAIPKIRRSDIKEWDLVQRQIELESNLYRKTKWKKAKEMEINSIVRDSKLDKMNFNLRTRSGY